MSRHRFEPARLLMGLLLCGAGVAYLLDAVGAVDLPAGLLAALVPVTLVLGACVALATFLVRRALTRRRGRPAAGSRGPAQP